MTETATVAKEATERPEYRKTFRYPNDRWDRAILIAQWLGEKSGVSGIIAAAVDKFIRKHDANFCAANPQYTPLNLSS